MSRESIIKLAKVSKVYSVNGKPDFFALKNINLDIKKGEKVAILGANGAGKTTLLKLLSGITAPSRGNILINGRVVSLISLTAGFHLEFTGRENIYLNASLLGLTQKEIKKLEREIIAFSGIIEFIDQALYTYSSGMILRLGFAIAIHTNPEILILDEEIIVGDQDFQAKAYERIEEMFEKGVTVIVSSHWLDFLRRLCHKFVWLEKGEIKQIGGQEVLLDYKKNRVEWWTEKKELKKQPNKEIFNLFKTLPLGETFKVLASSFSMEPFILKGDSLIIKRVSPGFLKVGQIIAFWSDEIGEIVIHRIKKINSRQVVTQGDNNLLEDSAINKKNILGVVELKK